MKNRSIFITLLFINILISASAQDVKIEYREDRGASHYYYYYTYKDTDEGYIVRSAKTMDGDTIEIQTLYTDNNFNTLKWDYLRDVDNTHTISVLSGNSVIMDGIHEGKEIHEEFELDENKWIQLFPLNPGLNEWLLADQEELRFWVIGNAGPADMEMNRFEARKEGTVDLAVMNENVKAIKINMNLTGWRSLFWDGFYYFRISDMKILKYSGDGAPGAPKSVTTIISEKTVK